MDTGTDENSGQYSNWARNSRSQVRLPFTMQSNSLGAIPVTKVPKSSSVSCLERYPVASSVSHRFGRVSFGTLITSSGSLGNSIWNRCISASSFDASVSIGCGQTQAFLGFNKKKKVSSIDKMTDRQLCIPHDIRIFAAPRQLLQIPPRDLPC